MLSRLTIAVRINLLLALAALGMLACAAIGLFGLRAQMLEEKRIQLSLIMDTVVAEARSQMNRSGGPATEAGRSAFLDVIKRAKFGDSPFSFFFVYDYDGIAVYHPDPSKHGQNRLNSVYPNGIKMAPIFLEIAKIGPHGGFVEYSGPDFRGSQGPKLAHFRDAPELKLAVGVGADIHDVEIAFLDRLRSMALLFASAMLAIGFVSVVISRSIRKPLSNAAGKIARLANGDLDIAPTKANEKSELGEVDRALDVLRANAIEQRTLQEKVHEQHELLISQERENEERWRLFVKQAPIAMLMLDRNMVHLACSDRWLELIGLEDGGIGRPHYEIFTQIPGHWKEAHRRGLAGETVRADEELFVRPGGGTIWARWGVCPWLTADGVVGGITIMGEDVTEKVAAAKALRESERLLRSFVEHAPAAICMLDRNLVHLACSRRWLEGCGLKGADIIGRHHYEVWPNMPESWKEAHRLGLAGEVVVGGDEELFDLLGGAIHYGRWEVRPWFTADESIGGIFIMFEDVTERVQTQRALRENELRMRLAQEAAKAGFWESRPSDKTNVWSENLWKLFGLKPYQCQPTREVWLSTIHPDDREAVSAEVRRSAIAGETFEVQWRVNRREGEPERWLFARGRPLTSGSSDHYFGVVIDITERKLMEQAVLESEMRMRLAQEAARAGAWEWRLKDNSLQWSDSAWSLYGFKKPGTWKSSIEGWAALLHPADRERALTVVTNAAALGHDYEVGWRLNTPEGEAERWFLTRGSPLTGADGRPDSYFGVTIDITQQKLMEEALRESKQRQSFLLSLNDALRVTDDPLEAIAIASEMLGQKLSAARVVYVATDETGRPGVAHEWSDGAPSGAFAVERTDDLTPSLAEELRKGQIVAVCDVRLDPRTRQPEAVMIFERGSIAAFISVPFIKNGKLMGGLGVHKRAPHAWTAEETALAREVAERTWEAVERTRVSQALRESEERLKFAIDAAEVGSWELFLEEGKYTASDRALHFFDLPPKTKPTYQDIVDRTHPDDRKALIDSLKVAAETGRQYKIEFRSLLSDGSTLWLDARGERRRLSGKLVIGGLIQDITERVNQKEAVEKASRAKSEFLSNMSHELRTPMHAILSYAKLGFTSGEAPEGGELEEYFQQIHASGKRLLGLLNDLLDLSKLESGGMVIKQAACDFVEVIEQARTELKPLLDAKTIGLMIDVTTNRTVSVIDKQRMVQVLINLVSNSIKFSSDGGEIRVTLSEGWLADGSEVLRCSVGDEGPGIPEAELEAVFDKFIQSSKTKSGAGGTGLGLSICREILKAHGGRIWAENRQPKGALFSFVIPYASAPPSQVHSHIAA